MSVLKCSFFQDLEGLTEVSGRMSAGTSGQKLPLWAELSFRNLSIPTQFSKEGQKSVFLLSGAIDLMSSAHHGGPAST